MPAPPPVADDELVVPSSGLTALQHSLYRMTFSISVLQKR